MRLQLQHAWLQVQLVYVDTRVATLFDVALRTLGGVQPRHGVSLRRLQIHGQGLQENCVGVCVLDGAVDSGHVTYLIFKVENAAFVFREGLGE